MPFLFALFFPGAVEENQQVEVLRKLQQGLFCRLDSLEETAVFKGLLNLFGELLEVLFLLQLRKFRAGKIKQLLEFEVIRKLLGQLPGMSDRFRVFPFLDPRAQVGLALGEPLFPPLLIPTLQCMRPKVLGGCIGGISLKQKIQGPQRVVKSLSAEEVSCFGEERLPLLLGLILARAFQELGDFRIARELLLRSNKKADAFFILEIGP